MIIELSPIAQFALRNVAFIIATALGTYIHWQKNILTQQKKAAANNITFDKTVFNASEKTARNMDIAANVFVFLIYLSITFNYGAEKIQFWWVAASYLIGGTIGYAGSVWITKIFGVTEGWLNEKISKQTNQKIEDNPEN